MFISMKDGALYFVPQALREVARREGYRMVRKCNPDEIFNESRIRLLQELKEDKKEESKVAELEKKIEALLASVVGLELQLAGLQKEDEKPTATKKKKITKVDGEE